MAGLFDGINVDATQEVEEQQVREATSWIKASGAYDVQVTMFRFKQSDGGANGFVIEMVSGDGEKIVQEDWFSSKAGDTTYAVKDRKTKIPTGERKDLPGMAKLKAISRALTGDALAFMKTEKKIVGIYNFDKKEDVDTEVDVFTEAVGKEVKILVQRTMEDKSALNPATGKYEGTHEYRNINEIVSWADVATGKTFSELAAGGEAKALAAFTKNIEKTPVKDNRKTSKHAPVGGQDAGTAAETAAPSAEATNAFS